MNPLRRLVLCAVMLIPAAAGAQDAGSPEPAPEQRWLEEIRRTVPAGEIRLAAAEAERLDSGDPLLELAEKHGIGEPDWLRAQARTRAVFVAGMGNSLTAATASCSLPYYFCPGNSWAVGNFPESLKRRLAAESGREVRGLLVSVPGVGAGTMPAEAFVVFLASFFGLDVRRVTLEIGHNDPGVCGRDEDGAVESFDEDLRATLRILGRVARRRGARVFLSSMLELPSIARYADVVPAGAGKTCREIWAEKKTCREVLGRLDDPERMARVSARIAAYDAVLARLAAERDWVIYTDALNSLTRRGVPEPEANLSRFDCFHPSASGQVLVARAAWEGDGASPGIAEFFRLEPAAPPALAELDSWSVLGPAR
ncbi:MAG: SGNH/GDSL hydrolase family protein [Elusimicrobia bacterium]|nr:SGNH/GDSL hydrolase family protein [Elusimicrobiota bacterium]